MSEKVSELVRSCPKPSNFRTTSDKINQLSEAFRTKISLIIRYLASKIGLSEVSEVKTALSNF